MTAVRRSEGRSKKRKKRWAAQTFDCTAHCHMTVMWTAIRTLGLRARVVLVVIVIMAVTVAMIMIVVVLVPAVVAFVIVIPFVVVLDAAM